MCERYKHVTYVSNNDGKPQTLGLHIQSQSNQEQCHSMEHLGLQIPHA